MGDSLHETKRGDDTPLPEPTWSLELRGGEGRGDLTPMFGEGGRDGESILYGGCHMTIKKVYLSVGLT